MGHHDARHRCVVPYMPAGCGWMILRFETAFERDETFGATKR
jgi:hypothetical protein